MTTDFPVKSIPLAHIYMTADFPVKSIP
jgi:hypothetical protein